MKPAYDHFTVECAANACQSAANMVHNPGFLQDSRHTRTVYAGHIRRKHLSLLGLLNAEAAKTPAVVADEIGVKG
jgi:hypothetical protein